jgi:hypothetical protein
MKAAKFFPVLIFVMMFTGFATLNAKDAPSSDASKLSAFKIRHEVTIHLPSGFTICNYSLYLVRITDENGRLAAPAQVFVPGVSKYVFNEGIFTTGKVRTASLYIPPYVDPNGCPVTLITKPDTKMGPFLPGRTYSYDLYPVIQGEDGSHGGK